MKFGQIFFLSYFFSISIFSVFSSPNAWAWSHFAQGEFKIEKVQRKILEKDLAIWIKSRFASELKGFDFVKYRVHFSEEMKTSLTHSDWGDTVFRVEKRARTYTLTLPYHFLRYLGTRDAYFAYIGMIVHDRDPLTAGLERFENDQFLVRLVNHMIESGRNPLGYLQVLIAAKKQREAVRPDVKLDLSKVQQRLNKFVTVKEENHFFALPKSITLKNHLEEKVKSLLSLLDPPRPLVSVFIDRGSSEGIVPRWIRDHSGLKFELYLPNEVHESLQSEDQFIALTLYTLFWFEKNGGKEVKNTQISLDEIGELDKKVANAMIAISKDKDFRYNPDHYFTLLQRINLKTQISQTMNKMGGKYKFQGIFSKMNSVLTENKINFSARGTNLQKLLHELSSDSKNSELFSHSSSIGKIETQFPSKFKARKVAKLSLEEEPFLEKPNEQANESLEHKLAQGNSALFKEVFKKIKEGTPLSGSKLRDLLRQLPQEERTLENWIAVVSSYGEREISYRIYPEDLVQLLPVKELELSVIQRLYPELDAVPFLSGTKSFYEFWINYALERADNNDDIHRFHLYYQKAKTRLNLADASKLKMIQASIPKMDLLPKNYVSLSDSRCSVVKVALDRLIHSAHSYSEIIGWMAVNNRCYGIIFVGEEINIPYFMERRPIRSLKTYKELGQDAPDERTLQALFLGSQQLSAEALTFENLNQLVVEILQSRDKVPQGRTFPFFRALSVYPEAKDRSRVFDLWSLVSSSNELNDLHKFATGNKFREVYLTGVEASASFHREEALLQMPLSSDNKTNREVFKVLVESDLSTEFLSKWLVTKQIQEKWYFDFLRAERPTKSLEEIFQALLAIDSKPESAWAQGKRFIRLLSKQDFTLKNESDLFQRLSQSSRAQIAPVIRNLFLGQVLRLTSSENRSDLVEIYVRLNSANVRLVSQTFCHLLEDQFPKLVVALGHSNPDLLFNGFTPSSLTILNKASCDANWNKKIYEILSKENISEQVLFRGLTKSNDPRYVQDFQKRYRRGFLSLNELLQDLKNIPDSDLQNAYSKKMIFSLRSSAFSLETVTAFASQAGSAVPGLYAYLRLLRDTEKPSELVQIHQYLAQLPKVDYTGYSSKVCSILNDHFKKMIDASFQVSMAHAQLDFDLTKFGCKSKFSEASALIQDFRKRNRRDLMSLDELALDLKNVKDSRFQNTYAKKVIFSLPSSAFSLKKVSEFASQVDAKSIPSLFAYLRLLKETEKAAELAQIHSYLAQVLKQNYSEESSKICDILNEHFEKMINGSFQVSPENAKFDFAPPDFGCTSKFSKQSAERMLLKTKKKHRLLDEESFVVEMLFSRRMKDIPGGLESVEKAVIESVSKNPGNILKFPIFTYNFLTLQDDWYKDSFIKGSLIRKFDPSSEYFLGWCRFLPLAQDKRRKAVRAWIEQKGSRTIEEWALLLKKVGLVAPQGLWDSDRQVIENAKGPLFDVNELKYLFSHLPETESSGENILKLVEAAGGLVNSNYLLHWAMMRTKNPETLVKIHRLLKGQTVDTFELADDPDFHRAYLLMIQSVFKNSPQDLIVRKGQNDASVSFYDSPLKSSKSIGKHTRLKNAALDDLTDSIIQAAPKMPSGLAWAWIDTYIPEKKLRKKPKSKDLKIGKTQAIIDVATRRDILTFELIPNEIKEAKSYKPDFSLKATMQKEILSHFPVKSFTLENLEGYIGLDEVWAKHGYGTSILENKLENGRTPLEEALEKRGDQKLIGAYQSAKRNLAQNPILIYDLEVSRELQQAFVEKMVEAKLWPENDLEKQHQVLLKLARRGPSEYTDRLLTKLYNHPDFNSPKDILEIAQARGLWDLGDRKSIFIRYLKLSKLMTDSGEFLKNPPDMDFYYHDIMVKINEFFPENSLQRSDLLEQLANDTLANEDQTEMIEKEKIRGQKEDAAVGLYLVNNLLNEYPSPQERMAFVKFFTMKKPLPQELDLKVRQQIGVKRLRWQFLQLPPYARALVLNALILENLLPHPKYREKLEKIIWKSGDEKYRDTMKVFYRGFVQAIRETRPSQESLFVSFLLGQCAIPEEEFPDGKPVERKHLGEQIKATLESRGGTGISIGQKLLQRQVLDEEYLKYLEDMTDHSPLPTRKKIYDQIRKLLGVERVDSVLRVKEILGGASTAMVVKVVLPNGQERALKMTFENLRTRTQYEKREMDLVLDFVVNDPKGGKKYDLLRPILDEVYEGLKAQEDLTLEKEKTGVMKALYENGPSDSPVQFKVIQTDTLPDDNPMGIPLFNRISPDHVFMELAKGKTLTRLSPEEKKIIFPFVFEKEMEILLANPGQDGFIHFEKDRHMGNFMADLQAHPPVISVFDYPLLSRIHYKERETVLKLIGWVYGRMERGTNIIYRMGIDHRIEKFLAHEIADGAIDPSEFSGKVSPLLDEGRGKEDEGKKKIVQRIFALLSLVDKVGVEKGIRVKKSIVPYIVALGHAERYGEFSPRKENRKGELVDAFYHKLEAPIYDLMKFEISGEVDLKEKERAPLAPPSTSSPLF